MKDPGKWPLSQVVFPFWKGQMRNLCRIGYLQPELTDASLFMRGTIDIGYMVIGYIWSNRLYGQHSLLCEGYLIIKYIGYMVLSNILSIFCWSQCRPYIRYLLYSLSGMDGCAIYVHRIGFLQPEMTQMPLFCNKEPQNLNIHGGGVNITRQQTCIDCDDLLKFPAYHRRFSDMCPFHHIYNFEGTDLPYRDAPR